MSEQLILKAGRTYRAKKPGKSGPGLVNDRTVVWTSIGGNQVQYDGPSVRVGQRRPTVTREAFLEWASHDVTDELEPGEYAKWPINKAAAA